MEQRASNQQQLPAHPVPQAVRNRPAPPSLSIGGLADGARVLTGEALAGLPRIELSEPFECEEGWSTPPLAWSGWRLADVLALAQPRSSAGWVRVMSGEYAVPLQLPDCQSAILADRLNGQPLDVDHGGPWRLVVPGDSCFTSVKWVDRLELAGQPGEETGKAIARARLTAQPAT